MRNFVSLIGLILLFSCAASDRKADETALLIIEANNEEGTFSVKRAGSREPLLVQHAKAGVRPYIHPIIAPDGKGELTELSPAHHKHQTGLYWGLKEVNGRDYFMNWKQDYWRFVSSEILDSKGQRVRWSTVYELLDDKGNAVLAETQTWSLIERDNTYVLDLLWEGKAHTDVTMGKFYVGGLFIRMPWHKGVDGEVVNSNGQRNGEAEGQRATWTDLGIRVPGRDDRGHIAILDHPDNDGFPIPWRVDNELGVGPSRQILGDWTIKQGATQRFRYRLIVYTGDHDKQLVQQRWKEFTSQ